MVLLPLLAACTSTADDTAASKDTDVPKDTDVAPGDFAMSLPAATSSADHALADRCAWELSVAYECENPSPEVRWENAPAGTVAFALVLDDPDAAEFDHWAVVNLPAEVGSLGAGISGQGIVADLPGDAYQLENGFGFEGYLGSCPPEPHVYRWRVWALSEALPTDLDRFTQVESQAAEVALATAETCHIYGPKTE
ncbi:MAG: YbhB/YbcL family Raf kinase inhibitor-like protein [Pseudomonadota bacterium]|nr:YbhB/YbcL family Raf kinase inhibitor-like protein [Pseudomonadota bacterium]